MARNDSIAPQPAPAPAVAASKSCLYADFYTGPRAALIAASLVPLGWFPGDEGRNKVQQSFEGAHGRNTVRRLGKDRFEVEISVSSDEVECREARRRADREIAKLAKSPAEFRERIASILDTNERAFEGARIGSGGYTIAAGSLEAIREAIDNLVETVQQAEVLSSTRARDREIVRIRGQAAAEDPAFQNLLAAIADPNPPNVIGD